MCQGSSERRAKGCSMWRGRELQRGCAAIFSPSSPSLLLRGCAASFGGGTGEARRAAGSSVAAVRNEWRAARRGKAKGRGGKENN
jgi:hypothetical protein